MKFIKALIAFAGLTAVSAQAPVATAQIDVSKVGTANSTGSQTVVEETDVIDWVITIENTGTTPLTNVVISDTLNSEQVIVPGTFEFPDIFEIDESGLTGTSVEFDVTADVIYPDGISLVNELGLNLETTSFETTTGVGDGWRVVFHPSTNRFFFASHHDDAIDVNCFDNSTGQECATYPKRFTTEGGLTAYSPNHNNAYDISGDHFYYSGRLTEGDDRFGFGCWNIVTETDCGFTELGDVTDSPQIDLLRPVSGISIQSPTRWWVLDARMTAHCFDPTLNQICAGANSQINFLPTHPDLEETDAPWDDERYDQRVDINMDGGKIYAVVDYPDAADSVNGYEGLYAVCLDTDTASTCAGWGGPQYLREDRKAGYAFFDRDVTGNGYQDRDEPGVATQRIVALVDGTAKTIRTDSKGRYHVPCASLPDQDIGSNIVLKLDERRAPSGFRVTSENPRVVRLTAGKMTKVNFGVQIARVVELSLNGCAFNGSSVELTDQSKDGMRALMDTLEAGRSTLRLTYRQQDEGNALVSRRTSNLADMVKDLWRDTNSSYKLDIELAQIRVIGQGPLNCAAPVSVAPQPAQQEKVEVIQKLTVQPAVQQQVQRTVKQVQQVQQVQQQYVQQYAQQQYVLQGYVTAEQLQQGYQSGLVQFNENGQAYTSNGYDLNAVNAGSVGQVYGGVATGYTSGGTATAAYGVGTSAYYGGTTGSAARAGVANIGSTSIGAGLVSGSVDAAPLTEETLRLLESMQNGNQTTVSTVGVDPLAGW